ncbi:MAG: hypothetical protein K2X69_04995, partial [Silvanigrellaceae bacterium]|nr:hypothetical protein [Silvanigrellaceae bacterium]
EVIQKYYPQAIAQLKLELKLENKVESQIENDVIKKVNTAWQDITQTAKKNIQLSIQGDKLALSKYDKQLILDEIEKISNNDKNSDIEVVKAIVKNVQKNTNKDLKIALEAQRDLKGLDSSEGKILQEYLNVIDGLQRKIDVERNVKIGVQAVLDNYYRNDKKIFKTKIDGLINSQAITETSDEFIKKWNKLFQDNNITNSVDSSIIINFKFLENLSKNDLQQKFITPLKFQKQKIDAKIKELPKDNIELIQGISVFDVNKSDLSNPKAEIIHPLYTKIVTELTDLQESVKAVNNINEDGKKHIKSNLDALVKDYNRVSTDDLKLQEITTIINKIKELYIQYPVSELNVELQVMLQIEPKIEQLQKYTQSINNFIDNLTEKQKDKWPEMLKKAEALSANNKKDLLNFIDNSNERKLMPTDISPEEIKALYEKIDTELKVKETINFKDTQAGKFSNAIFTQIPRAFENKSVYGVVVAAAQGVGHGVGAVGDAGAAFTNCVGEIFAAIGLSKEHFSPKTLVAIAVVATSLSSLFGLIQNNNNLTDDQKKKLKQCQS